MAERILIDVECYRGPGDRPGADIVDSMITTQTMAKAIGKAEIDAEWWVTRSIQVSHQFSPDIVKDGQVVTIAAPEAAHPGTKATVEAIRGSLVVGENRAPVLSYETTLEAHEEPPEGFGT